MYCIPECNGDWLPFTDKSCIWITDPSFNAELGQTFCESLGGTLIEPKDQSEVELISKIAKEEFVDFPPHGWFHTGYSRGETHDFEGAQTGNVIR